MAYATVAQYEALYGTVADEDMLQEWLDRASRAVDREFADHCITPDAALTALAGDVVCSMVRRALPDEVDSSMPVGMTQFSMTAGSYTQSGSFPSGFGELYLTKMDREMLGVNSTLAAYHFRG